MTKISNNVAYPFNNPISLDDYWIGTSADTKQTRNFLMADVGALVLSMITGEVKSWITYVVPEDGSAIQSEDLIGAASIDMLVGQNAIYKTADENVTFDSETGTISDFPVLEGEKYVIYYTKPLDVEEEEEE